MFYAHNNLSSIGQSAWSRNHKRGDQKGVVLVIALILLIVMSLLAVTSMRSASSSESVAGNVRTTELATQAAETALRHCESSAIMITKGSPTDVNDPAYYSTTLDSTKLRRTLTAEEWKTIGTWDGTSTAVYELPSTVVGGTTTFKRPPECMVESLTGTTAPIFGSSAKDAFLITARGFGPEVPALVTTGTRIRPVGTEVWLQSTIEIP